MFVKITRSAGRQYVKLVEAFRDDRGVPCQRVIATLGRLEAVRAGDSNALIDGLLRAAGRPKVEASDVAFAPALSVGDTWLLSRHADVQAVLRAPTGRMQPPGQEATR